MDKAPRYEHGGAIQRIPVLPDRTHYTQDFQSRERLLFITFVQPRRWWSLLK
jgi:hypothetical protein